MLLAQQDARPLIEFTSAPLWEEHGIPLAVMGILVVFSALVLIVAFITFLPRLLARIADVEPQQPAASPIPVEGELSEEMVVVIAAAVAATLSKPHRIVKIRGLTPAELGWSLEGRAQQHQSHQLRSSNR